jgi:hypothetical protein
MIVVAAAVVADRRAHGGFDRIQLRQQALDRPVGVLRCLVQRFVQFVDIGLVMLAMVEAQRLCADHGLQTIEGVGQGGQFMLHRQAHSS